MSWTGVAGTTVSWGGASASAASWSASTSTSASWTATASTTASWGDQVVPVIPPPWGGLRSLNSSDGGVDFRLHVKAQFPDYLSDDRPIVVYDIQPEGIP